MAKGPHTAAASIKVGFLVIASVVAFVIFLQIVSTRGVSRAGSYQLHAYFDDVLGLEKKSPVQIAGIDIGRIHGVSLEKGKAKVTLEIDGDVGLYEDASIEKVSISLLGDYKLSIEPGSESQTQLKDGDFLKNVRSTSNVDAVIAEVREISKAMRRLVAGEPGQPAPLEMIVRDVQGSAKAARTVLEEVNGNISKNTEQLTKILENIEEFTLDMRQLSHTNNQQVSKIIDDARAISSSLRSTSEGLESMMVGEDGEESESMASIRDTLDKVSGSLENIESITDKVDRGEGTAGKLINDSSLHDNLSETAEGINSLVGGISRLQTWVNLRSEFQFRTGATKNYVQFSLEPTEDKAYIFEVVDDPRGVTRVVTEDVSTTSPETGRDFQYRERRLVTTDDIKFSLMFAKRYYWLTLRFGIIEDTGGVGANLRFLENRLHLLVDINRFGEETRNPRFKILASVELLPHVYVHGGVDDAINSGTIDYFMGLGVRFNDRDLKTLLTVGGGALSN